MQILYTFKAYKKDLNLCLYVVNGAFKLMEVVSMGTTNLPGIPVCPKK